VDAICAEEDLPEGQQNFLALNAELAQQWPVITEMKDPPPDSDQWRDVKDKLQYLER
jgi:ferredoxin